MRSSMVKRLEDLAVRAEARASAPIWVDMHNTSVRIDVGGKRGETLTFDTVHEAARYLEKQMDAHERATGSISVDHLADLYPDSDALRRRLRHILPEPIECDGAIISADDLPAVKLGDLKPARPADVRLLLVAGAIYEHFGGAFRQRYAAGNLTESDNRLFTALFAVWSWQRPGEPRALLGAFSALVHQVARLPTIETSD